RPQPRLDLGELPRERALREGLAPARPRVVEGPGADDPQAGRPRVLHGQEPLRGLADGVRVPGPERGVLADGKVLGLDQAVLLGAAHDENVRRERVAAEAFEQVHEAEHVRAQRSSGVEPGLVHARLAREVEHALGPHLAHRGLDRGRVVEVGLEQPHAHGRPRERAPVGTPEAADLHVGPLRAEVLHEVAAHEARDAGDQEPQWKIGPHLRYVPESSAPLDVRNTPPYTRAGDYRGSVSTRQRSRYWTGHSVKTDASRAVRDL